jgi:hypothetical protein
MTVVRFQVGATRDLSSGGPSLKSCPKDRLP